MSVVDGKEKVRAEGDTWFYRCEGCDAHGIEDMESMEVIVRNNYEYAYSAFQTAFVLDYANYQKPAVEVFSKDILSKRILKDSALRNVNGLDISYHDVLTQNYFEDGQRLSSTQILDDEFQNTAIPLSKSKYSHADCIRVAEVFLQTPYRHTFSDYTKIREWQKLPDDQKGDMPDEDIIEVDMKSILTNEVREVIDNIDT